MDSNKTKETRICILCGKTLRAIGTARKNGKTYHGDWKSRKYHKKCFKNS